MTDPTSASAETELLGAPGEAETYRSLFRNTAFRRLFLAMLTSSLGDWIGLFAILALTESILGATRAAAFALSAVMVARVLPTLLLGPVAGVFVDRWDRKQTMIVTDIGRCVVMAAIAWSGDVFQLVVATFLIEVMSTIFIPAKDATLPNLVRRERLVQANQLSLMVTYGTLPLGAGLFAVLSGIASTFLDGLPLVGDRPIALAIWVNAATFLVSGYFIWRIDVPRNGRSQQRGKAGEEQPGAWQELVEGFRFIANQPLVRALVVGVMAAFLSAGAVVAVGKLFVTIVNAGDTGFGVLGAAVGIGLFIGLAAAGPLSRRLDKERLFAPGIGVAGAALVVAALMPRLDLAVIPAVVMGAGAGVSFIVGYTMLQEHSADEIRGRTFAAFNTGVRAALFASLVVGPFLTGVIGVESAGPDGVYGYTVGGVRITLIVAGVVAFGGAVWTGRAIHGVLTERIGLAPPKRGEQRRVGPGFFVAFEGGDGAGKSTQIRLLRHAIEREGYEVLVSREPGGTELGEELRHLLLDPQSPSIGDRAEALLYAAARAQHADEVLRPALERGAVVLCDRYMDSSVVYQGAVRELGERQVEELNRWGTDDLAPDVVVLLDIDAEEGLRRVAGGQRSLPGVPDTRVDPDRLEAEGVGFHRRVNEAFRKRAARTPGRYVVVDASGEAEDVAGQIRRAVLERLRDVERREDTGPLARDTMPMARAELEDLGVVERSHEG